MMNPKPSLKTLIPRITLAAFAVLHLAGCSKTVQWEEEVPLNTGETIWVKRTVKYTYQGGAGNPFDMAYRPERAEMIDLTWNGKHYRYEGEARVSLLAISPQKRPVLVARAPDSSWDAKHGYRCTLPFYVQFVPDDTGQIWTWPSQIDGWLFNLPTNLLRVRHPPERMKNRYTAIEVQQENSPGSENRPSQQKIDPAYTGDLCGRK
ncbi:MAG: hypothetical protein OEL86_02285 [Sulfuritalea sp.]|nr:hypothetical protein [Sulfuritalea sp.]